MAATALRRKLNRLLAGRFRDFDSGLLINVDADRVLGYIVSSEFKSPDHARRQRQLKSVLDDLEAEGLLTPKDRERIGPIVTMRPVEASITDHRTAKPRKAVTRRNRSVARRAA